MEIGEIHWPRCISKFAHNEKRAPLLWPGFGQRHSSGSKCAKLRPLRAAYLAKGRPVRVRGGPLE